MNLTGIGFANFRSIGQEPVWLDLTKKVNILIGANNAGKSNVFRALQFVREKKGGYGRLDEVDRHKRDGTKNLILYLRANVTAEDKGLSPHFKEIRLGVEYSANNQGVVDNPFSEMEFLRFSDVLEKYTGERFISRIGNPELKQYKDKVALILANNLLLPQVPAVFIIPDIRKIDDSDQYNYDGRGIIKTLASWQVPKLGQESLEAKFHRLNGLLQRLLRTPNVHLEVPPERDVIIVRRNGLRLPLSSMARGSTS
jgi:predicted ATP-dependent endonuclease of OLD family